MNRQASHATSASLSTLRLLPEVGLVDLSDPAVPERLAGKVSDQLEVFATRMREGLLAASVAIGLDVMGELVDTEVAWASPGSPLIAATTTQTGLTVQAAYDPEWYATGVKISNKQLAAIPLTPHEWHGEWNYTIAQSNPR